MSMREGNIREREREGPVSCYCLLHTGLVGFDGIERPNVILHEDETSKHSGLFRLIIRL